MHSGLQGKIDLLRTDGLIGRVIIVMIIVLHSSGDFIRTAHPTLSCSVMAENDMSINCGVATSTAMRPQTKQFHTTYPTMPQEKEEDELLMALPFGQK